MQDGSSNYILKIKASASSDKRDHSTLPFYRQSCTKECLVFPLCHLPLTSATFNILKDSFTSFEINHTIPLVKH